MNIHKLRRMAASIPKDIERKEQTPEQKLELEIKGIRDQILEAVKAKADTETIKALEKKMGDIASQLDALDLKMNTERFGGGGPEVKSAGQAFVESDDFKAAHEGNFVALHSKDGRIRVPLPDLFSGRKAITTIGLGTGTAGVQMPMRLPGVTGLPQQELRIRDLMTVRQMTTGNSFDYVRSLARVNNASPQNEGARKAESTFTWEAKSGTVKTIAHFTKSSRQAIDDVAWLRSAIDGELLYGLSLKEETEILMGDGTGQHLDGITHQATAYDTGRNVSGDHRMDQLRHAKLQARLAGLGTFAPDGYVLNPTDVEKIELIKTEEGGANKGLYIIGDPKTGPAVKLLWGLPVVESDTIPTGKFLVGSFSAGAELIDRMAAMVSIAFESEADFVENLCTILCECRVGLAVRRPESFIYGTFV